MKRFCFELTDELCAQISCPVRTKEDVISLLINTIKVLLSLPVTEENRSQNTNKIILFVDRMSRLFFCVENKIFTINFPFYVSKSEASETLTIRYRHITIDSYISSLIISIFAENETFTIPLDNMKEFIFQHMAENGWEDVELEDVCEIVKKLIVFEAGYLRYDHDILHTNGRLHPEHHLDLYYDSNNEIKIGMDAPIDDNWLIDFANITTACRFIK